MEKFEFIIPSSNWGIALQSLSKQELKNLCIELNIPFENKTRERMAELISKCIDLDERIKIVVNINKK